ncbi:MAG TPA: serine hydrolase [Longimicrobium sp.]|nr:serine hydrolase [Longimicrobium sp.]
MPTLPCSLRPLSITAAFAMGAWATPLVAQQAPPRRPDLAAFDAYAAQAARDWRVPGLAVAIVQGDSVVFEKGYGVRTIGRTELVDAHTLFAVGSLTKAFTAAALLMLVDSGKVDLDAPVRRYLPAFELKDPYVTRELTVRDLLTHRSGVAPGNILAELGYPRADLLRRMRELPQVSSPRSVFGYNNLSYVVAGEVAAAASGTQWDELVRTRLLAPIGMTETVTGYAGLAGRTNVASAHLRRGDTTFSILEGDIDNVGPAASIHSSAHDMARWLAFILDSAHVGGRRQLSPAAYASMFTPQSVVPDSYYPGARLAGTRLVSYGLGWFLEDYRGRFVAMHTGSIEGMSAIVGIIPDLGVGVVVLANLDHAELRHALLYRVLDLYTGAPERDWSTELRALYAHEEANADSTLARRLARRTQGTRPTLPLERYAGLYREPAYGDLRVRVEAGHLVATLGPRLTGDLEHWNWDTFRVRYREPSHRGPGFLTFALGPDGTPETATFEGLRPYRRVEQPTPGSR